MFSKNLEVCPHDSFHCHKKWRAITGRLTHGIWCKVCCEIVGGWRTSRQHGNHTINFEHSFRHVEFFGVVYLQFKYTLFPVEYDSFELLTVSEDNVKICIMIQLQMTMLFMVEYDKKNVSMIVSEDNEISWFIFKYLWRLLVFVENIYIKNSHMAWFYKRKGNPKLYNSFRFFIIKCINLKFFKLLFYIWYFLLYSSVIVLWVIDKIPTLKNVDVLKF